MERTLLRVTEAAQLLSVSRWTIYRWVEEGRLEATKISRGSLRIFRRSIDALIEDNRTDESPFGKISQVPMVPQVAVSARRR